MEIQRWVERILIANFEASGLSEKMALALSYCVFGLCRVLEEASLFHVRIPFLSP